MIILTSCNGGMSTSLLSLCFSILAKDIFTIPVSTISSESIYNTTGRIIEERRRRLNPETVEALTCIKDWENAESRLQHMVEDKELEEAFKAHYLDVD